MFLAYSKGAIFPIGSNRLAASQKFLSSSWWIDAHSMVNPRALGGKLPSITARVSISIIAVKSF